MDALQSARSLVESAVWHRLDGQCFAVLGLGRSGVAAANALARRGADVLCWDDAPQERLEAMIAKLDPRVQVRCGQSYVARPAEIAVISPGIGPTSAAWRRVHDSAFEVIGEIELFYRLDRACNHGLGHPILAVTGTDGKTTTASLLAALLTSAGHEVALAGNIGDPLCGLVDQLSNQAVIVAEVSAFQLITAPLFRPRVAILTNIAADHVDYFGGDYEAYAEAKLRLTYRCGPGDTVIYNGADERLHQWAQVRGDQGCRWIAFSARQALPSGALLRDGMLMLCRPGESLTFARSDELGADGERPWGGVHNFDNALAASAAATAFGVAPAAILSGLRTFAPPPHRCEPAGHIAGVRFVNDSKATNPHAALAGVRGTVLAQEEVLVWVGGGSEKDSDFGELASVVKRQAVAAVLCGATAARIAAALDESAGPCEVHVVDDLHAALPLAWQLASPKGCVLFSPACASFDAFRSYAHRGDVFKEAVERLRVAFDAQTSAD